MTDLLKSDQSQSPPSDDTTAPERAPQAKIGGRLALVILMIISLPTMYITQTISRARMATLIQQSGSTANLSDLSSYTLALLLGGLRGPLVMALWSSSETQKHERNLEDFDTKIELIRQLQPQFDTVLIYQIWNKVYNISAQMASLANKYSTILDGLKYARQMDRQRPEDINIEVAIGDIYFNKLGGSSEREYYQKRVRDESKWRAEDKGWSEPAWKPTRLYAMLDASGNLLPDKAEELRYLKPYQPFPYGVPPRALGFNYYKMAQELQTNTPQRHLQLSTFVIDSRPPIILKEWMDWETQRSRRLEAAAMGKALPDNVEDRGVLEQLTARMPLNGRLNDRSFIDEACYHYDMAIRLADDAEREYVRHVQASQKGIMRFRSHRDEVRAMKWLAQADKDYLLAVAGPMASRPEHARAALAEYKQARRWWAVLILKYCLDDGVAMKLFPPPSNPNDIDNLSESQIERLMVEFYRLEGGARSISGSSDRDEYERYIERCVIRQRELLGSAE